MQLFSRHIFSSLLVCLLVFGLFLVSEAQDALKDYPVKNLRVPVDLYEDGSDKVKLMAEGARVVREGETELVGVRVEFYTPEGQLDGKAYSEKCMYHTKIKAVMSQDFVRIERAGLVVTGIGFEWHSNSGIFEISNKGKVEFSRKLEDTGELTSSTVRGDYVVIDYNNRTALFDGNVIAEDILGTIESDKLSVVFEEKDSVKSVTADGNVRGEAKGGTGKCEKAIYLASDSKVIMTGSPEVEAEGNRIVGDKITVWVDEGRASVEPGRIIVPGKKASAFSGHELDSEPKRREGDS